MPGDELSDAELLEAWRGGDSGAGQALFARHYRSLKQFFRNKVSADRVADLIQETFVSSVESRDQIVDSRRFRAYLLRIAYHVFCRYVHQHRRAGITVDFDDVSLEYLGASPVEVAARVQEQRLLLEGLRSIPINYQVVLELHYWEELSTNEIAEILGAPAGTIRSRLVRARDVLEAAMTQIAQSPDLLESTVTRLEHWAAQCGRVLAGSSRADR